MPEPDGPDAASIAMQVVPLGAKVREVLGTSITAAKRTVQTR